MEMYKIELSSLFDGSNLIRRKVNEEMQEWNELEGKYDRTFKQFMTTKKGKQILLNYTRRYLYKVYGVDRFTVGNVTIKNDLLKVEILSNEERIGYEIMNTSNHVMFLHEGYEQIA